MSDILPPEHGLAPHNMPSRPWTRDPLQNIMILPEELIQKILEDLAVAEVVEIARLPLGEFTWRPHLVHNSTVPVFTERYSPIWEYYLSKVVSVEVLCRLSGEFVTIRDDRIVSWSIRNSLFYGPLAAHEIQSAHFEDSPFDCQLREGIHIEGYDHEGNDCEARGWQSCVCNCVHNLALYFDEAYQGLRATNRSHEGCFRYEMCPLTQELAAAHGLAQRGLRHTFIYNGGELDHETLLSRSFTSCPCCKSGTKISPTFILEEDAAYHMNGSRSLRLPARVTRI